MQTRPCPTCGETWGFAFHMCPYDRTPLPVLRSTTQPSLAAVPAPPEPPPLPLANAATRRTPSRAPETTPTPTRASARQTSTRAYASISSFRDALAELEQVFTAVEATLPLRA